jgi:hypothetical protein
MNYKEGNPGCCTCGSVGISLPPCLCTNLPVHITVSSNAPCADPLTPYTLSYGPTPAILIAHGLPANTYLSDLTYPSGGGEGFRYYVRCNLGQYLLAFVGTGPTNFTLAPDFVRFTPTAAGNSCSPFLMIGHANADFTCIYTLTG